MPNPLKELFYAKIRYELRGCARILDLGCGFSSYVSILRGKRYSVGVDAYQPHLDESRRKRIHDEYILSDIVEADFPEKSFDAVICCQAIEHLTKNDAEALFKKMELWASKKILITIPNSPHGFAPPGESERHSGGFDRYSDLKLMNHMSGWTVDDLERLGYRVNGFQGFQRFFGRPGFQKLLYYATFPLSYLAPREARQLLAVKNLHI